MILSLSIGGSRDFTLIKNEDGTKRVVKLQNYDLAVMEGFFQHFWKHKVPKDNSTEARINLTWRHIYDHSLSGSCPISSSN